MRPRGYLGLVEHNHVAWYQFVRLPDKDDRVDELLAPAGRGVRYTTFTLAVECVHDRQAVVTCKQQQYLLTFHGYITKIPFHPRPPSAP